MDPKKKKIAIVSVCSVVLVAMVVALVIGSSGPEEEKAPEVSASQKAITTICETTDYQQTCLDSLAGHNSSNPKELIEVAFQATIRYLREAAANSSTIKDLQNDPRAKAALDNCNELANNAIADFQRSFDKFSSFDITNVNDILLDLKIWLSGAITQQETCLEGFQGVEGDAGEKMKAALNTSMQMTSNALAMVAEIATFLEAMGMQDFSSSSSSMRRLLSADEVTVLGHGDEMPEWLDLTKRKLLTVPVRKIIPNVIVAKDGSGKYRTINEALTDIPKNSNETFVMYIKAGVYEEIVRINSTFKHVMIVGDGPTRTRITGKLNFIDGTGTYQTATVAVQGDDFIARDIGFENSAGAEKHQAVALRVSADKAVFYNCQMDGYQDTLYAHTYRQFYRDCVISGTIDFIFGDSAALFQGCTIVVRKPLENQQCIVTAQGRKDIRQPTGLVLQNCTFIADPEYLPYKKSIKSYLGRPWKEFSRTVIMESFLDDIIQPDGWLKWNDTFALDTLFYTEFNNRGPAAPKKDRVKWKGVKELPPGRVQRFTAAEFLDGNRWIPPTQVPYSSGFIFPVPKEDPNIKYSPVEPEETKDLGAKIDRAALLAAATEKKKKKDDSDDHSDSKKDDSDSKKDDDSDSDSKKEDSDSKKDDSDSGSDSKKSSSSSSSSSSTHHPPPPPEEEVPAPPPPEPIVIIPPPIIVETDISAAPVGSVSIPPTQSLMPGFEYSNVASSHQPDSATGNLGSILDSGSDAYAPISTFVSTHGANVASAPTPTSLRSSSDITASSPISTTTTTDAASVPMSSQSYKEEAASSPATSVSSTASASAPQSSSSSSDIAVTPNTSHSNAGAPQS